VEGGVYREFGIGRISLIYHIKLAKWYLTPLHLVLI